MAKFKKAIKSKSFLRLGLAGVSGSGKTFSALRLAKGMLGEEMSETTCAVIDTEHGSASLYSDRFDFAVLEVSKPFSPDKYIAAMKAAQKEGFKVLILDSLSHAWAGDGGLLSIKDKVAKDSKKGNSFTAWAVVTPMHTRLVETFLELPLHVIGTLRSKQGYAMAAGENGGKTSVKKIGLEPVFRDGFEYECTIFFDVGLDGNLATAGKDRSSLFANKSPFKISEETGKSILTWLMDGEPSENDGKELLLNLLECVDATTNLEELSAFWKANQDAIRKLNSMHLEELSKAKDLQKKKLSNGKEEKEDVPY